MVEKFNPAGKLGLTLNVILPYPPAADTGVMFAVSTDFVKEVVGTSVVKINAAGADTPTVKVPVPTCPTTSVIVTE